MFSNLTGWHALIILAAVLLIFGAAKLPALARSVGQSVRILKSETKTPDDEAAAAPDALAPATTEALAPGANEALAPAATEREPVATTARTAS